MTTGGCGIDLNMALILIASSCSVMVFTTLSCKEPLFLRGGITTVRVGMDDFTPVPMSFGCLVVVFGCETGTGSGGTGGRGAVGATGSVGLYSDERRSGGMGYVVVCNEVGVSTGGDGKGFELDSGFTISSLFEPPSPSSLLDKSRVRVAFEIVVED